MKLKTFLCPECKGIRKEYAEMYRSDSGKDFTPADRLFTAVNCAGANFFGQCIPANGGQDCIIKNPPDYDMHGYV